MAEADPRKTFNIHEAKTQFSRLIDRAHAGEKIIVAKAGVPYAKLVPVEPVAKRKRQPGGWPELASIPQSVWFDPLPEDELQLWEGKHRDPFDRLIAAQARIENLIVVTRDRQIAGFGCEMLW